jgi:hypothetical protein
MALDECSPVTIFLQSEHEARRFRDKVKFDCFKPAFIKTPIEEIHIDDSEDDGNADLRSVAGYVKRREGVRRSVEPPPRSNAKSQNHLDSRPEKEADGLEAGSGIGGEDGEGGSGDRGRDGTKSDGQIEEERDKAGGGNYENQFVWPEDEQDADREDFPKEYDVMFRMTDRNDVYEDARRVNREWAKEEKIEREMDAGYLWALQ